MFSTMMQKGNLDTSAEVDVHGKIKKETVSLDTVTVTRVTSARSRTSALAAPESAVGVGLGVGAGLAPISLTSSRFCFG